MANRYSYHHTKARIRASIKAKIRAIIKYGHVLTAEEQGIKPEIVK